MPKFITIGYGDREGYERMSNAAREAAHAHDQHLQERGVLMGIAGTPTQVGNPEAARVETAQGPFMSSPLPISGFAVLEAPNLKEAIAMVSKTPCAVAHGVVEVWPLEQPE